MSSKTFDTIYPADSLEFCPTPGFEDLFVCGTYKLLDSDQAQDSSEPDATISKQPQKRRGHCLLFRTNTPDEFDAPDFDLIHTTDLPAIPDMKWSPGARTDPLLAIADSEGSVMIHSYDKDNNRLRQLQAIKCVSSDTLCLSLDWSNRRQLYNSSTNSIGSLIVSLSNGSLCLLTPSEGSMEIQDTWHAHDFEPWIAAWDYWNENVVYSGGDDLKLKSWDVREGFTRPSFTNKRFEAGVTTIQSHPLVEHLLAVGSYDAIIRLFDTRNLLQPLASTSVGGGVWRAKWHPSPNRKGDLLLACMHDGFKVVRFDGGLLSSAHLWGKIVQHYTAHESLAYGADWSYAPPLKDGKSLMGCCSFYDHKMSVVLA